MMREDMRMNAVNPKQHSLNSGDLTILPLENRVDTTYSGIIENHIAKGGHFIINVTSVPGTDTITPSIQGYDSVNNYYYDILVGAPISTVGVTILKVYPGITPLPNASANDILPVTWRITVTHSSNSSFQYSVSSNLNG